MTYLDLLQTQNWKTFRHVILARDNWTCLKCSNSFLEQELALPFNKAFINPKSTLNRNGLTSFIVESVYETDFGGIVLPSFFWHEDKEFFDKLTLDSSCSVLSNSSEGKDGNKYSHLVALKRESEFLYVRNIHIHHTYYQDGLNPWEYPTTSLQSLCWQCHEDLHKSSSVIYLDKNGFEIGSLTPCSRCFGAGYLPQYSYYMDGICFACNGRKYQEFIK